MDLKTLLFEKTMEALKQYYHDVNDVERCADSHATFCTLYSLIEAAGLEGEYYDWKARKTK